MQQAEQQRQIWADSPFSLITSTGVKARPEIPQDHYAREFARSMAGIHNVLLRALNASYNQCLSVSPGDEARDFFIFNQAFYTMLQSHHDMEEESLFPAIGKVSGNPDAMAVNVREHADFEKELLQFKNYIFETEPKDYDGPQMKSLIDRLGPLLQKHLHNEISTLLDLHVVGSAALKGVFSNAERGTSGGMHDLFKHIPFTLVCADNTFELDGQVDPQFLPNFAKQLLKLTFGWRYSGAWRFAPCDFSGNPRPLSLPNASNL